MRFKSFNWRDMNRRFTFDEAVGYLREHLDSAYKSWKNITISVDSCVGDSTSIMCSVSKTEEGVTRPITMQIDCPSNIFRRQDEVRNAVYTEQNAWYRLKRNKAGMFELQTKLHLHKDLPWAHCLVDGLVSTSRANCEMYSVSLDACNTDVITMRGVVFDCARHWLRLRNAYAGV